MQFRKSMYNYLEIWIWGIIFAKVLIFMKKNNPIYEYFE